MPPAKKTRAAAKPQPAAVTEDAPDAVEVTPTTSKQQTALITRVNGQGDWWCPVCDTSMNSLITTCGGCGATRDGDRVVLGDE